VLLTATGFSPLLRLSMSFRASLRRWISSFFAIEGDIAALGGELIGFEAGFEVLESSFLPLLTLMRPARSDHVSFFVVALEISQTYRSFSSLRS
jgi:hypothetical protein